MRKFWNWTNRPRNENESGAERVLELYGTIAEQSWFDDDVTPQMFKDELFSGTGPVTIWLDSMSKKSLKSWSDRSDAVIAR